MKNGVAERKEQILQRIDRAAKASGRTLEDIILVGVTKTLPVSLVLEGVESGLVNFGENRFQGVEEKIAEVENNLNPPLANKLTWHFIGHIQSNKAKKIIETFDYIQSIDSLKLLNRIERLAGEVNKRIKGLIQVNISGADTQGGIPIQELEETLDKVGELNYLTVEGFMAIGPRTDDLERIRTTYRLFKSKLDELKTKKYTSIKFDQISMGMSGDFEIAIEEGATIVRVGTALFGPRQQ